MAGSDDVAMDGPGFQDLQGLPLDTECFMLNLIRFRERAEYQLGDPESVGPTVTGREAYQRYSREVRAIPQLAAGQWVWEGAPWSVLIGASGEKWDIAFIRKYLTARSFIEMIESPEYRHAARHRRAAVEDSRLIICGPGTYSAELAAANT